MKALHQHLQGIAQLSTADWEAAAPLFSRRHLAAGEYFLRHGQYCNEVAFVESGLFKLFYLQDGVERVMLFFPEQSFVTDYFAYLNETPSIRPVQALEDSVILSIQREGLQQLFARSFAWNTVGRQLAEQAYLTAVERANRMLHDEPTTRLRDFLEQQPDLLQRVPQYLIASYLQMTPETLSRVKKRLMTTTRTAPSIHATKTPPTS